MEARLKATAACIRCWNNPHVAGQVRNLITMSVGRIYVCVNAEPDDGSTNGYLGGLLQDSRVRVIEIFKGWSWCNALNRAWMAMAIENASRQSRGEKQFRFFFPISVEAKIEQHHLEQMLDAMSDETDIAAVGTSFKGLQNGNEISLGRSYQHPRNTGMVWSTDLLGANFSWDSFCDDAGGMEDADKLIALQAMMGLRFSHLDLQVPLVVGVNYHQPTKEQREQDALDKIVARWRSFFAEGTPERETIEGVITSMYLQ